MCGIAAVVGGPLDPALAEASLRQLTHRGPDVGGQFQCEHAWLGHRRLSIVDVTEAGNQPLVNETGDVYLVCNGEIYNAPRLRGDLEKLGHRFRSRSDSEVIVHAYEQWGDACVQRLQGMFAFAIWDAPQRRLLAARDRVGIKPLYLAPRASGLALASELAGLLPLIDPQPEISPEAIGYVMTLGYIPSPMSIWQGIEKLEPGCMLVWSNGRIRRQSYWQPPEALDSDSNGDATLWQDLWPGVLQDHLMSDVPLGLFLSGGLDSSSVAVGLAALGVRLKALTIGFADSPRDEAPVAARVADQLGLTCQTWDLPPDSLAALTTETLAAMDEPQGGSGPLPMRLLCRHAAAQFKVVLSGDGGDEVHGGYRWYESLRPTDITRRAATLRRVLRPVVARTAQRRIWRVAAQAFTGASAMHRHAGRKFLRFLPEEVEHLLQPTGVQFDDERMLAPLQRHWRPQLPMRRALQRVDLMTFCSDLVLAKVDRASMALGLEVRVPMLDQRLLEWGLSRPLEPGEDGQLKPVLKRYLRNHLPQDVLEHPKQGFSVPIMGQADIDNWIQLIQDGPLVADGLLAANWHSRVGAGTPRRHGRIWVLLAVSEWLRLWRSRAAARP